MNYWTVIIGAKLSRVALIPNETETHNLHSKKISRLVTAHAERADLSGKKLRVIFQDEGRFGRICDPRACWAPKPIRPIVKAQHIREYIYAFAAVSPADGCITSLVTDHVNAETMSLFLAEVVKEYPDEEILMITDGASWHKTKNLRIPSAITLIYLPPYSPELNPVEHLWDDLREKYFPNRCFDSIDAVYHALVDALQKQNQRQHNIASLTNFSWIREPGYENWH